ncbi:family 1 encapsulin nanocompartment shell protein [Clostridiisalibacter paucivorans]|uniref:family 1 encapsulin nanocompartment shell protein n=1 Tax=Clostridiisalibacter paucivorans TaxID=408753 RepID=UPI00047D6202|nr:family 1 encapsulin nanocompartment shell protein [Clostridiisalibacter paucivorans]
MLKRELAPITDKVWEEIDERASDVLKTFLSARKVVKVEGPKGWDYTAIEDGRLKGVDVEEDDISFGIYDIKPLIETRMEFALDRWELDNLTRGAKDIDLEPLEDAVKKIAMFEEDAVYNGLEKGSIQGLVNEANTKLKFGKNSAEILENISEGILNLKKAYAEGPYTLVVGEEAFKRINSESSGYPLLKRIESLIGGNIVLSHALDGALLLPFDHDDLELTVGNDFSIGYQAHDIKKIRFFITESFTFRVLDPNIIVKYNM